MACKQGKLHDIVHCTASMPTTHSPVKLDSFTSNSAEKMVRTFPEPCGEVIPEDRGTGFRTRPDCLVRRNIGNPVNVRSLARCRLFLRKVFFRNRVFLLGHGLLKVHFACTCQRPSLLTGEKNSVDPQNTYFFSRPPLQIRFFSPAASKNTEF
jgi:hypothetical protein